MTSHARAMGISHFHPRAMNWSYRKRSSVARVQMSRNMKNHILRKNQTMPIHPEARNSTWDSGQGACQPPRNMVVATAETLSMFTYSDR